ncbi:MAG: hypothetical protein ISS25_01445 [Nanoarchaeota archaeon]|nr:hypothetical protein [DPANN group archaeon]MBL7116478.1 hypothetical protein [Nanoarchaeota archaeon]
MPCEFKLKNYCFHPERASGELIAINCAYGWLHRIIDEEKSKKLDQGSGG